MDVRGASFAPLRGWGIAGTILAATLLAAGCSDSGQEVRDRAREVSSRTAQAEVRQVALTVPATGSLEASRTVTISTRMMGWVRRIHVSEGDRVRAGDPLISIDDTDLRAQKEQVEAGIAEARAVLANAEARAGRFQKLYAEKSVSRQQLDDVLTGRDRAAAGLRAALAMREEVEVNIRYLEITAPAGGMIARKMIEEGNLASPGAPLLVLEQVDSMKVVARLGEKHVSSVKRGTPVRVDVTSLADARYAVALDKVIPTANPGSRTYDIETHLPNPDGRLKSGMFARVEVPVGERSAVLVPAGSIVVRGQLRGVHVVDAEGTVHLRWIRLGREHGEAVEVLSGLEGGETVAVSSAEPLREGDKVVR